MEKSLTFIHTADLHQGIDFSVQKWRKNIYQRSDDFLDNFLIIINRSLKNDIDFIVLAGDIFNRSKPDPIIKRIVIDNIIKVSKIKPVLIIPGNHDKSRISAGLLFIHPNIRLYNKPTIETLSIKGLKLLITAIPFLRNEKLEIIEKFTNKSLKYNDKAFKICILHELVESCKVGIQNFEFTKTMKDVVPIAMLDDIYDYIALGHVHKFQKIAQAKTSMYFSGSVERTSIVEREEEKGYLFVKVLFNEDGSAKAVIPTFQILAARELIYFKFESLENFSFEHFIEEISQKLVNSTKSPLIMIRIINFDNYSLYKSIKSFLKSLKNKSEIFDFQITSPDFQRKIKSKVTQERINIIK